MTALLNTSRDDSDTCPWIEKTGEDFSTWELDFRGSGTVELKFHIRGSWRDGARD